MTDPFRDQSALVTGAASGIGAALVAELCRRGARVWMTDLDADRLETAADALRAEQPSARVYTARLDVTDAAAFAAVVAQVEAAEDGLDQLYNNAGVGLVGELRDLAPTDWQTVLAVNLQGTINGIHAAYPGMVRRGRGHIVNIASGAGLAPRPGMVPYSTAKGAVVALSRSLRAEARGLGVKVTAVCPGYIETGIANRTRFVGIDRERLTAKIPIEPITADECARRTLRGVARDVAVLPVGAEVAWEWRLMRWMPRLVDRIAAWRAGHFRASRTVAD